MSISPDNFWPIGAFAHIFIPKYVCPEGSICVFKHTVTKRHSGVPSHPAILLWGEAKGKQMDKWERHHTVGFTLDRHTVGHQSYQQHAIQPNWRHTGQSSAKMESHDAQDWARSVCVVWLVCLPYGNHFCQKNCINWKVHISNEVLTACKRISLHDTQPQMGATDVPMATRQKVQLQSSDIHTWNNLGEEDIASGSSSSGRGSSL